MHDPTRSRPGYEDEAAARLVAPAAARNAPHIARALAALLHDEAGPALEIGAGTGQHAVAIAAALPRLAWTPSDPDPLHIESIQAWRAHAALDNLRPPMRLDAADPWADAAALTLGPLRVVYCANVIHIAPWAVAEGLVANAARALAPDGRLILYGPFLEAGAEAASNRDFDASLRARDPSWGVRQLAEVSALAARHGFAAPSRTGMPANNLLLAFGRR